MGSKRPFDGQEPLQLPYKYTKQFASHEKLTSFVDEKWDPVGSMDKLIKPPLFFDHFELNSVQEVNTVVDRALFDGFCFPSGMDSYGYSNAWCGDEQRSVLPVNCVDPFFPIRKPVKGYSAISSFLDRYPRKQVPVGENHQATVPEREYFKPKWCLNGASNADQVLITDEENLLMGTCIIPMPDSTLSAQCTLPAGFNRKDCDCDDKASVRCVRQHVLEARDKLAKLIGEESFWNLGFLDMGEDVLNKWSEEEELIFNRIVFSNPASHGKDFWPCLIEEFPNRSMKDIISYYFNVFMLRIRAAQNRSRFLDIDSDDDEWHPDHAHSNNLNLAAEDDENYFSNEDDTSFADDYARGTLQLKNDFFPIKQDGPCSSLGYKSSIDPHPANTGLPTEELNTHIPSQQTESENGLNPECIVDSSHISQWDHGFSAGLDHLLPTQNMIEELFGPGSWDNKPNHD